MGFSESPASSPNGKSSKRADANRQNAQKSTGPRTPEGKTRSSLNAVKHGLTAQTALLPGESYEELDALARSLHAQLKPVGALQGILAERVVSLTWKLRRCASAEAEVGRQLREDAIEAGRVSGILRTFAPPVPNGTEMLAEEFVRPNSGRCLQRLTEYELKLETALRRTIQELRQLQKDERFAVEAEGIEAAAPAAPPAAENEANSAPPSARPAAPEAPPAGEEIPPEQNEPIPPVARRPDVTEPQPPAPPLDRN